MPQTIGESSSCIDLRQKLSAFVITNGRSTYDYCVKALEDSQNVCFEYSVIRDKDWLAANQEIVKQCVTPFFVRVDDDMLVHPRCIEYMWHCVKTQHPKVALRQWELWEPYNNRSVRSIKVYTHSLVQRVGFRINHLGKIDKPFREDCDKMHYDIESQKDIIGIHSCSDIEEHVKYAKMRGEDKGKGFKRKEKDMRKAIKNCKLSLEEQFEQRKSYLVKQNKIRGEDFYGWLHRS